MTKQRIWNDETEEFELVEISSVFGCNPDQDLSQYPDNMLHGHIHLEENKMKTKISMWFWNLMGKIDDFNHRHFENSVFLWNLFGDWFCNWYCKNDPDMNYEFNIEKLLDKMDKEK